MANFGPLTAENGSGVCGTPETFNKFRVLPSLLQQHCSTDLNQTTHDVFGRLLCWYTIYTFLGALAPKGNLPGAKFALHPSLAFASIGSISAWHSSSGRQPNFAASYKEWNYQTFADGATYIWQGGHHVGHRPTF